MPTGFSVVVYGLICTTTGRVVIKTLQCLSWLYSNEQNSLMVTTRPTVNSAIHQPLAISVVLQDGTRLVTGYKFRYRLDPRLLKIEPLNHLIV